MKFLSLDGLKVFYKSLLEKIDKKITNKIDEIEIGGQNLIDGTQEFVITNADSFQLCNSHIMSNESYKGLTVRGNESLWNFYRFYITLEPGTYTFSAYAKGNTPRIQKWLGDTNGTCYYTEVYTGITTEWKRISMTFTLPVKVSVSPRFESADKGSDASDTSYILYLCGYKLERGPYATDWTPSVNDQISTISKLSSRIEALEGKATSTETE